MKAARAARMAKYKGSRFSYILKAPLIYSLVGFMKVLAYFSITGHEMELIPLKINGVNYLLEFYYRINES